MTIVKINAAPPNLRQGAIKAASRYHPSGRYTKHAPWGKITSISYGDFLKNEPALVFPLFLARISRRGLVSRP